MKNGKFLAGVAATLIAAVTYGDKAVNVIKNLLDIKKEMNANDKSKGNKSEPKIGQSEQPAPTKDISKPLGQNLPPKADAPSRLVTLEVGRSAELCGVSLRLGRSELSSAGYRLVQGGVLPSEQRMFDIGPRRSIAVTPECRVRVVGMETFAGGTMMVVTLEEERKP